MFKYGYASLLAEIAVRYFTSHNDVMSYKRYVYYWYLVMGIPQLQVTSEFSWDRDIYAEHWCFPCCKPEWDVEQLDGKLNETP